MHPHVSHATNQPTSQPANQPTSQPANQPTSQPVLAQPYCTTSTATNNATNIHMFHYDISIGTARPAKVTKNKTGGTCQHSPASRPLMAAAFLRHKWECAHSQMQCPKAVHELHCLLAHAPARKRHKPECTMIRGDGSWGSWGFCG